MKNIFIIAILALAVVEIKSSCDEDDVEVKVDVVVEYTKRADKSQKTYLKTVASSKEFREDYLSIEASVSAEGSGAIFSGSASAAFAMVKSSSSNSEAFKSQESSNEIVYQDGNYQIFRILTTTVSITGAHVSTATVIEKKYVQATTEDLSTDDLNNMATQYLKNYYGVDGLKFTESKCVPHEEHINKGVGYFLGWANRNMNGKSITRKCQKGYHVTRATMMYQSGYGVVDLNFKCFKDHEDLQTFANGMTDNKDGYEVREVTCEKGFKHLVTRTQSGYGVVNAKSRCADAADNSNRNSYTDNWNGSDDEETGKTCKPGETITGFKVREQSGYGIVNVGVYCG